MNVLTRTKSRCVTRVDVVSGPVDERVLRAADQIAAPNARAVTVGPGGEGTDRPRSGPGVSDLVSGPNDRSARTGDHLAVISAPH